MRGDKQIDILLENYRQKLVDPGEQLPPPVQRSALCIHTHLFEFRLTVGWIKSQCYLNGKSYSARFKRHMNYYLKDYIIHHRIEASKLLLAETKASVTQIALAVGYASLSAFCNTFKNKEGIRPSKWRKLQGNNKELN